MDYPLDVLNVNKILMKMLKMILNVLNVEIMYNVNLKVKTMDLLDLPKLEAMLILYSTISTLKNNVLPVTKVV